MRGQVRLCHDYMCDQSSAANMPEMGGGNEAGFRKGRWKFKSGGSGRRRPDGASRNANTKKVGPWTSVEGGGSLVRPSEPKAERGQMGVFRSAVGGRNFRLGSPRGTDWLGWLNGFGGGEV